MPVSYRSCPFCLCYSMKSIRIMCKLYPHTHIHTSINVFDILFDVSFRERAELDKI